MAELQEVIRQTVRMCREHERCDGCPMKTFSRGGCPFYWFANRVWTSEDIERVIMAWAAEHPEPVYPSWQDAWNQLFPKAISGVPCPKHFIDERRFDGMCIGMECTECIEKPMSADIAEKLGIKPVEVTK